MIEERKKIGESGFKVHGWDILESSSNEEEEKMI